MSRTDQNQAMMWHGGPGKDHRSWYQLVAALERVAVLNDINSRKLCLDLLSEYLGYHLQVRTLGSTRQDLFAILLACQQHSRALPTLIDVLDELEPGSHAMRRVRQVFEDMSAAPLLPDEQRDRLMEILSDIDCPHFAMLCRKAAGPAIGEPPPGRPLPDEVVSYLEGRNARADGLPPLLLFVEYLAQHRTDHRRGWLHQWNDQQAARMKLVRELLAVRDETSNAIGAPHGITACLVIRLERDLLDQDRYQMAHWRQADPTGWHPRRGPDTSGTLSELEHAVAMLVEDAESNWACDADSISIEFLLPLELLDLPVDLFRLDIDTDVPVPVGMRYHVAVRSLDRARARKWHREWKRRWEQLHGPADAVADQTPPSSGAISLWCRSAANSHHLRGLETELALNPAVVSLVLSTRPSNQPAGAASEVYVGLRNGLPIMIWYRGDGTRRSFEAAVRPIADGFDALREQTRLLRSAAHAAARPLTHVGSRVALMWDDPERLVEPAGLPSAPGSEETR